MMMHRYISNHHFTQQIQDIFQYPLGGNNVSVQLLQLSQGTDSAAEYAVKFCSLSVETGWNDPALKAIFCKGLNPSLQAELTCRDEDTTLSQYINTAIRLDNLIHNHLPQTGTRALLLDPAIQRPLQIGQCPQRNINDARSFGYAVWVVLMDTAVLHARRNPPLDY